MRCNFAHPACGLVAAFLIFSCGGSVRGQVLFNEIMFHPPPAIPEDTRKEWLELFNASTAAVNLDGWRLTKGVGFNFTNTTIAAGGWLVVAADLATFQANYPGVTNAVGGWTGKLSNGGEKIELTDNLGQVADAVSYASDGDWALLRLGEIYPGQPTWWRGWGWTNEADGGGKSVELINPALSNKPGQNWKASLVAGGTPGRANSVASDDIAPLILDVQHVPAIPHSTDSVTITAQILDEAVSSVTVQLFSRVDGAASFAATPMFDDGAHGDGVADDGYFGAVLPPQPDKTVVEFYIRATDAAGHTRTWPRPCTIARCGWDSLSSSAFPRATPSRKITSGTAS